MIRKFETTDMKDVLTIWLDASIQAHDFIESDYWRSNLDSMRDVYLPASEVVVAEVDCMVVGFYALHSNHLAAIFVDPKKQGKGIGKELLQHAKAQRPTLTLNVYQENVSSYEFYLKQGFKVETEQADEHTGHKEYVMVFS